MTKCIEKLLPLLTLFSNIFNISKNRQISGIKMEKLCKLCCQANSFKTLVEDSGCQQVYKRD